MVFAQRRKASKLHLCVFAFSFLLFASIILILANPGISQGTDIYISIDQDLQKVDFTVEGIHTVYVTGNITIDTDSAAETVYFGVYAPQGWTTSISPEEITVTYGETTVSFEGTITPNLEQSSSEGYYVYVWASIEEKNPSERDIISSTSNVFSESSIIEIIKNRVIMFSDVKEQRLLPDALITHTFTVTNAATVTETAS
jgi:hypothetical protein